MCHDIIIIYYYHRRGPQTIDRELHQTRALAHNRFAMQKISTSKHDEVICIHVKMIAIHLLTVPLMDSALYSCTTPSLQCLNKITSGECTFFRSFRNDLKREREREKE